MGLYLPSICPSVRGSQAPNELLVYGPATPEYALMACGDLISALNCHLCHFMIGCVKMTDTNMYKMQYERHMMKTK